ncbi:swi/snf complex subunit swi3d [Phtheirospermum japonicum]|uniref:Swi/snf complex subunit swi3d n=1 Tax=Phtheirospermum japonicum TaxID=374723 RepID=A0A830CJY3_9LAMI|nr:swi/snf complex subunit swi3d [Phtheirospermum japonicum]
MEEKRRDLTGTPPPLASMAEAPHSEQPVSRRRGGGQKRKSASINSGGGGSSTSQTTSSKRQAREKPPVVPFPPIHMNGPLTRARLQPYNSNSFAEVAPVKSEAEAREAAAKAEEMSRAIENWEALEAKIEAEYEAVKSRDANVHVVPIHAGWFSWTKIHPLEERMLPSFFNGKFESRTPEIYTEIRNWIMKKFHLNPNEQIESKHLSELAVGKLDARQEVMEFLDYWGLINYHPFPHQEPAAAAEKDEARKMGALVEKLFKFETVQSWTPMLPKMSTTIPAMSSGLFPESVIADELVKSEGPAVEYHCNSCSADCSRKRYHCQKQADFDLCADCFNNGKFDSNMSPSDFILMEPAEAGGASGGKWTDQETLLLLEAIEIFRDNWSEIAEHVATKTKAQCILHFVQMPIEDAFFDRDDENSDTSKENGVPVSTTTENLSPKAEQDSDTALKDVHENTETQGGGNADNQDSSCPMEISKPDEVGESDRNVEVGESFALKALNEAFEAVGSLPSPGKGLSFAEVGNPVMALAAFLGRLVDPNIANASVHSLLKSVTGYYSSEQLAARHCFPLEDPPDYKKNLADSEGAEADATEHEAEKNEIQNAEKLKETPDSNPISSLDDENERKKDSVAPEEHDEKKDSDSNDQKPVGSPSSDCADTSDTVKDPNKMSSHQEAQPDSESQPSSSDVPKEHAPKDAEKLDVPASHTEHQSDNVKESEDGASAGGATQSKDPPKDEDMTSLPEKKETNLLVISNSTTEKENTGDKEATESGSEKKETIVAKNDLDANSKLKRAAVTALSAAAVKAKLLADQEEDQILQLSTLLVEKQLHKLETKLAFFNDMESVVMRVKELLERSKQKLFHERAQIIATRFGMSASARPPTQILPPNRAAANLPNSGSRPFMGMNLIRPPNARPMMPTANPTPGNFMSASSTGGSMQPNTDRLSSVGMNMK